MADTLDRERPFATIHGKHPVLSGGKAIFSQDGKYYGNSDEYVGKVPNWKPPAKASVRKKEEDTVLDKAKTIIGGLDPRAQVRRENAAAAAAETLIGREYE